MVTSALRMLPSYTCFNGIGIKGGEAILEILGLIPISPKLFCL